jgi:hypothetical protein
MWYFYSDNFFNDKCPPRSGIGCKLLSLSAIKFLAATCQTIQRWSHLYLNLPHFCSEAISCAGWTTLVSHVFCCVISAPRAHLDRTSSLAWSPHLSIEASRITCQQIAHVQSSFELICTDFCAFGNLGSFGMWSARWAQILGQSWRSLGIAPTTQIAEEYFEKWLHALWKCQNQNENYVPKGAM